MSLRLIIDMSEYANTANIGGYGAPMILLTLLIALVLLAQSHECTGAQTLGLQVQMRYDFFENKKAGESPNGDGHLSTNYSLAMRGPVMPFSALISDVTLGTSSTNDQFGSQDNRSLGINLYYRQPSYTLMGRVNRNDYQSETLGQGGTSIGNSSNYNLSMLISQPAYPVLNLQYSRNVSGSSFGDSASSYASNTWLLGSYYDLMPLRFTFDQSRQTSAYSGSSGNTQMTRRSSVFLNQTLLQGLTLFGELSNYATDNERAEGNSRMDTKRQVLRLQATPTRAIAASLEYSDQSSHQGAAAVNSNSGDNALSLNVRAQVLPGLSADYTDRRQETSITDALGRVISFDSNNRNLGVSARLSDQSVLNASLSRSDYAGALSSGSSQNSLQVSLQSALSRAADISLDYGRNKSTIGSDGGFSGSFAGISFRTRTAGGMSMGASYRRSQTDSFSADASPVSQTTDAVDVDALWMPNYQLSLNLRLSYQVSNGSSISETLSPALGVRWQIDPASNLSLNYNFQSDKQWDWINWQFVGQRRRGSVLRLSHSFLDRSSLELYYDFHSGNTGLIDWQRHFALYYARYL